MGSNPQDNPDHRGEGHPQQRGQARKPRELSGNEHKQVLVRTLTQHIIPRLVSAQPPSPRAPIERPRDPDAVGGQEVLEFVQLVLQVDESALFERMQDLRMRGLSHQVLLTELLLPVATHLGRLWENDLCDFQDVTLAVGRLQRLLRHCAPPLPLTCMEGRPARRVLLSTCRGEQHTFGLSVVAEFFLQAGWDVVMGHPGSDASPVHLVREQWFDVIGLSLGSSVLDEQFDRLIAALRKASLNQQVPIMAGGPMFLLHPAQYATRFALDAIMTDASLTPARAEQLLLRQATLQPQETAQ
jgi:methanogenic corrinoid protein MtbC1